MKNTPRYRSRLFTVLSFCLLLAFAGPLRAQPPAGAGDLIIAGGGIAGAWDEIWDEIVARQLPDRPILIFSTGSESDAAALSVGQNLRDRVNTKYGPGTAVYVHITENNNGGDDPANAATIRGGGGAFFTGGGQTRILRGFTHPNGTPRPAFEALWEIYLEGAPIAGSSAGAAIMSDPMITGGTSGDALLYGLTAPGVSPSGVVYRQGLGFYPGVLFDQHHLERGRLGRLVAALADPIMGAWLGVGIAEDTALLVSNETLVGTFIGAKGGFVVDVRELNRLDRRQLSGIRLHSLERGDSVNLITGEVTPAAGKAITAPGEPPAELQAPAWGTNSLWNLVNRLADTMDTDSAFANEANFQLTLTKTADTVVYRDPLEEPGARPTWMVTDLDVSVLRQIATVDLFLHDWQFNDPAGTPLSATLNSARPGVTWNGNYDNSATTGDGSFRIRRDGSGLNRRVDVGETGGAEMLYMLVEFGGWNLSNPVNAGSGGIELRMHFMNGPAAENPGQITAGMRLIRNANGTVSLQADAAGTAAPGGETSAPAALFPEVLEEPLALVTAYNTIDHEYSVYYRMGSGEWEPFFTGNTSGVRSAESFRLWISGDFDGAGVNFLDLDRFAISTVFPEGADQPGVPEARLRIERDDPSGSLRLHLSDPVPGRQYQLKTSANLSSWTDVDDPRTGGAAPLTWEVPVPAGSGFFIVEGVDP